MKNHPQAIALSYGKGIATRNPELSVKIEFEIGVALLIFDQSDKSGGLAHFLPAEGQNAISLNTRIQKLASTVGAKRPAAKLVSSESPQLVSLIKAILAQMHIKCVADSTDQVGKVTLLANPASGTIRFKRKTAVKVAPPSKVKVLIVDDAPFIRKLLRQVISQDSDLEIVGEAGSAAEADTLLKTITPDVLTLDIHMPVEDGVSFLGRLLARKFFPVVLVTSVSMSESEKVFEALSIGAIDYIQKPAFDEIKEVGSLICDKLKMAAKVKQKNKGESKPLSRLPNRIKTRSNPTKSEGPSQFRLVAIGASTGGVQALTEILTHLPDSIPPIVIVQHIPPVFSKAFCDRLDRICGFRVKEAEDGDLILPDQVLIAPGGFHMRVEQTGGKLLVRVFDGERVNRHKPSVEVMFKSVANVVGAGALGIILTGMGDDGAEGLLMMKNKGAITIAQDEASCVVFGMPGEAVKRGAAQRVLPLTEITRELVDLARYKKAG